MTPDERSSRLFSALLFVAAGTLLIGVLRPGPDLAVVLEDGHSILNEGMPPSTDPYSFACDPRVDLEPVAWLTGAAYALVEWLAPWRGLRSLATLLLLSGLALLWRGARDLAPSPMVRAIVLGLALIASVPGLEVSDLTPAFLMTSWLIFLMLRFPSDPGVAPQLPFLIWLWSLTSPTWIGGLVIAWIWIFTTLATHVPDPDAPPGSPELRTLTTMGLVALLVPIVTPASFGGYAGAWATLAGRIHAADLIAPSGPSATHGLWILLLATSTAVARRSPAAAATGVWPLLLLGMCEPSWWPLAVLFGVPQILEAAGLVLERGAWRLAMLAAVTGAMMAWAWPPSRPHREDAALGAIARQLEQVPRESRGNTLTELEWGVSLGRLSPASQVVATRRLAAFDNGVIEDHRELLQARQPELLDVYGISAVVLRPGRPLARMLARFDDWDMLWKSEDMVAFQRPWHWTRGGRPVTLRIPRRGSTTSLSAPR